MFTRGYKGLEEVTGGYKRVQGVGGLLKVTGGYKWVIVGLRCYSGLQ